MNSGLLASLEINHVRDYLRQMGWRVDKSNEDREIWVADDETRVLLPRRRLDDFVSLAAELVVRVAANARRSEDDVLIELSWPGYDKLTARTHADSASPAVPIQEAIGATDALRDLVVAAARASESRQANFRGGWSSTVGRYFDRVQMIPSMPGSFTLRALLPINAEPPEQLLLPALDTASIRSVSRTLISGVRAARDAAEARSQGAGTNVFDAAVSEGVSAELLDALVRLGGPEGETSAVELGVTWTYSAPEPRSEPIRIEPGLLPVLAEGVAVLRASVEEVSAVLTGSVTRLHREPNIGAGEVTVQGYLDAGAGSSTRSMKFELDEYSYSRAIAAHRDGSTVRVACIVRFDSPRLVVVRVTSFELGVAR